ncbi:hypothetical protein OK142_07195 [Agrobacterium sp. BT-220-3]|nr:hypothetical protein [Agrobacterium sp. BT-220-3]
MSVLVPAAIVGPAELMLAVSFVPGTRKYPYQLEAENQSPVGDPSQRMVSAAADDVSAAENMRAKRLVEPAEELRETAIAFTPDLCGFFPSETRQNQPDIQAPLPALFRPVLIRRITLQDNSISSLWKIIVSINSIKSTLTGRINIKQSATGALCEINEKIVRIA